MLFWSLQYWYSNGYTCIIQNFNKSSSIRFLTNLWMNVIFRISTFYLHLVKIFFSMFAVFNIIFMGFCTCRTLDFDNTVLQRFDQVNQQSSDSSGSTSDQISLLFHLASTQLFSPLHAMEFLTCFVAVVSEFCFGVLLWESLSKPLISQLSLKMTGKIHRKI